MSYANGFNIHTHTHTHTHTNTHTRTHTHTHTETDKPIAIKRYLAHLPKNSRKNVSCRARCTNFFKHIAFVLAQCSQRNFVIKDTNLDVVFFKSVIICVTLFELGDGYKKNEQIDRVNAFCERSITTRPFNFF